LVKVSDLGYASKNLGDIPSKEEKKKMAYELAISNLVGSSLPSNLKRTPFFSSLVNFSVGD